MLNLITQGAEHIYLACGPTDFRKQIEGLAALVSLRYQLDWIYVNTLDKKSRKIMLLF